MRATIAILICASPLLAVVVLFIGQRLSRRYTRIADTAMWWPMPDCRCDRCERWRREHPVGCWPRREYMSPPEDAYDRPMREAFKQPEE